MKRKEQNRAAQRAFRERKEKHVKDVSVVLSPYLDFYLLIIHSWRIKLPSLKPKTSKHRTKTRIFEICSLGFEARTWLSNNPPSHSPLPKSLLNL